jgi:DNA processing protein
VKLEFEKSDYPDALRELPNPPRVLTTSGPLVRAPGMRAIAIVGSRDACDEALVFAHGLAFQLASAGVLVISGGAVGVDGAAHRGAMAAGGTTWVVSPTGKNRLYPPQHKELFEEVAASSDSRMLWSFDDDESRTDHSFRYRNGVLAALSEVLVMVQAHYKSGSRNAARWARSMGRPVWAVPAAPWMGAFCGSISEIEQETARPLYSVGKFFEVLGLGEPTCPPEVSPSMFHADRPREINRPSLTPKKPPPKPVDQGGWEPDEILLFSKISLVPIHPDEMATRTGLSAISVSTALLTLSLKDVVVEGPNGFFRRKSAG